MKDIKESLVRNIGIGMKKAVEDHFVECTDLKGTASFFDIVYDEKAKEIQISQNNGYGIGFTVDYNKYSEYFKGIKLFFERSCSNVVIENYIGKVTDLISGAPKNIKFTNSEIVLGKFQASVLAIGYNTTVIDFNDADWKFDRVTIDISTLAHNFGQMIGKFKYDVNGHAQIVSYS